MRKIFLCLILFYGHLYALDRESTLKMYHKLLFSLSPKAIVSVYVDDDEYRKVFSFSKRIQLINEPENADIVLITNESTLYSILENPILQNSIYKKPILFATDYRFLKRSDDIIGAFYWRKGRSQLLFIKDRLDRHHILLPREYKDFLVDEL